MARHSEERQLRGGLRKSGRKDPPASVERTVAVSREEGASLLEQAEVVAYEQLATGSNYTFLVLMAAGDGMELLAIYKPLRGERPLWDFPHGTLHLRERAAYLTSRHLGWPNVPVTVIRDGPFGVGSLQLYIPTSAQTELPAFQRERWPGLVEVALFDLLVNNADRKAGHCLPGADGRIWAIDHGLTFNVMPKLRTVLWEYCGEPVPRRLLEDLVSLRENPTRREALRADLEPILDPGEIRAFFARVEKLLRAGRFPQLDPGRNIPWPLV